MKLSAIVWNQRSWFQCFVFTPLALSLRERATVGYQSGGDSCSRSASSKIAAGMAIRAKATNTKKRTLSACCTFARAPAVRFARKSEPEVTKLISGPNVYICDECVEVCVDLVRQTRTRRSS